MPENISDASHTDPKPGPSDGGRELTITELRAIYCISGESIGDRIMNAQATSSQVYLQGDPAPTKNQVAAVMHALADFTLIQHLLSDEVKTLGQDHAQYGEKWAQATAIGRLFHGIGDDLEP